MSKKLVFKKTLRLISSLLLFSAILYSLLVLSTGDPAIILLQKLGTQVISHEAIIEIKQQLGIHGNFLQQYSSWLLQIIKLDFGTSFMTNQSVGKLIAEKSVVTINLIGTTFLISCPISLILGVWLGNQSYAKWFNQLFTIVLSLPIYLLAIIAIFLLGIKLQWLPFIGSKSVQNYILPIFVLCIAEVSYLTKMVSELITDIANSERQRLACFKGIKKRYRFYYQLHELTVPLISLYGNNLIHLFGAGVIIEIIFSMSGLGKLLMDAISVRDYPLIQGITLVVACYTFLLSFLIDLAIQKIDSRILINQQQNNA